MMDRVGLTSGPVFGGRMNLVEMVDQFRKHTSSLATDLSDSEVAVYLNRCYQYTIPLDVGGEFTEALWELTCIIDQAVYDYPEPMVAASGKEPWCKSYLKQVGLLLIPTSIGITYLSYETDPDIFERKYLSRSSSGRPTAALFYGGQIKLSAPPDDRYVITIPVRSGPILELTDDGIVHGTHARCVVSGAALEYLSEIQDLDDPGSTREAGLYRRYSNQLQTYALARPSTRNYTRSF